MKKALLVLMAFLILSPNVIVANLNEKPRLRIEPFILWGYNDSDMETIITMLSMQDSLRMAYNIVADDAEYVLVTDVGRLGDATVLMMRILNVNDSTQIANGNLTFHAITEIVEQIPQIAGRLAAPILARRLQPTPRAQTQVTARQTAAATPAADDGDFATIIQFVGDLVKSTVGGRFGETVGNVVGNVVVERLRQELGRRGVSANDNVGEIVSGIVAETVSAEIAKNVPGPAGRMGGGRVGKAVGESVERAVNDILSGRTPNLETYSSGGGRREGSGRTRTGVRVALNGAGADVDIYSSQGVLLDSINTPMSAGFTLGFVLNTQMSRVWSFVYGVDLIYRMPVYDSANDKPIVTETAVAFPALIRLGGMPFNNFGAYFGGGFQLDITGSGDNFDRNTPDIGYVFDLGFHFGRHVEYGFRLYFGMRDFTAGDDAKLFQVNANLTYMFRGWEEMRR